MPAYKDKTRASRQQLATDIIGVQNDRGDMGKDRTWRGKIRMEQRGIERKKTGVEEGQKRRAGRKKIKKGRGKG